jgi:hypothetical protein
VTAIKTPHYWQASHYGNGKWVCAYCLATNREISVIGDMNHCPEAHKALFPATAVLEENKP